MSSAFPIPKPTASQASGNCGRLLVLLGAARASQPLVIVGRGVMNSCGVRLRWSFPRFQSSQESKRGIRNAFRIPVLSKAADHVSNLAKDWQRHAQRISASGEDIE